MDFFSSMHVSATGLAAGRLQMNVVSENLANTNTTRTPEGEPYRRKFVVLSSQAVDEHKEMAVGGDPVQGVQVVEVARDQSPFPTIHNPEHPDADEDGNVRLPNVSVITEMANMLMAKRVYDSNATALSTARSMAMKALEIGR